VNVDDVFYTIAAKAFEEVENPPEFEDTFFN
jgi:hypothetical protein